MKPSACALPDYAGRMVPGAGVQVTENAKARKGESAKCIKAPFRAFALSRFRVLNPGLPRTARVTRVGLCLFATFAAWRPAAATPDQPTPDTPPPPPVSASAAMLVDTVTGTVLFERNAYQRRPMASTTKIMTA